MVDLKNVTEFFARYDADEELRERLRIAEQCYPGSLEIRESVCEDVLLPVAAELGLPFSIMELRVYETKVKAYRERDEKMTEEELNDNSDHRYWLIEHRWSYDYEGVMKERGIEY